MTDKQMLEMAAKAAGIECLGKLGWRLPCGQTQSWWNPLTDDGDAFRLAVKLNIQHYLVWDGENDEYSTDVAHRYPQVRHVEEYCGMTDGQDIYKATRRAIVRAAAEIGRVL